MMFISCICCSYVINFGLRGIWWGGNERLWEWEGKIWVFGVRMVELDNLVLHRSNGPEGRSNGKARLGGRSNVSLGRSNVKAWAKTWPLAIRTPLAGVRTPRPSSGGVRTVLWAFERQCSFWPVLLGWLSFLLLCCSWNLQDYIWCI